MVIKNKIKPFFDTVSPLKFFIITASIFGLLFLLITPPFQGADEPSHFLRAYQISQLDFLAVKSGGVKGGYMTTSLAQVIKTTDTPAIEFHPNYKYNIYATHTALHIEDSPNKRFYDFSQSAAYAPASYLFAPVFMGISRLLHLPTLLAMYAGRLGNLFNWVLLIGLAIHFMPRRKWVLVAVGLLPMALFQASTINGDAVTIGSAALALALVLKWAALRRPLSWRNYVGLLFVLAIMVLSKLVMFLFLPLVFLLRRYNFSSGRRELLAKLGLVAIPLVVFGLWLHAAHGVNAGDVIANRENPSQQFSFILHNPHSYVNVLWNTTFYTWGDNVTRSAIGTFGWADTPLSELIIVIGYVGLTLLLIGSYGNEKKSRPASVLGKSGKWLIFAIALLYWLAVDTSLYLYYSPVGFKIIYGLQGRYFLPLLVLAIPLLRSSKIRIDANFYRKLAVGLPLFLLVASTITIYVRYFVNNV